MCMCIYIYVHIYIYIYIYVYVYIYMYTFYAIYVILYTLYTYIYILDDIWDGIWDTTFLDAFLGFYRLYNSAAFPQRHPSLSAPPWPCHLHHRRCRSGPGALGNQWSWENHRKTIGKWWFNGIFHGI